MRLIKATSSDIESTIKSSVSDFSKFSYVESQSTVRMDSSRVPSGPIMRDINALSKKRSRKLVISSDDESVNGSNDDVEWLEKRNPLLMTQQQLQHNKDLAKKALTIKRIPKRVRSPVEQRNIEDIESPIASKFFNKYNEDLTDTPDTNGNEYPVELDERKAALDRLIEKRKQGNKQERQNRVQRRKNIIIDDDDDDEDISSNTKENSSGLVSEVVPNESDQIDEDENEDIEPDEKSDNEDEGWHSDGISDEKVANEKSRRILSHCSEVSDNLRDALATWQGVVDRDSSEATTLTCVNLISIRDSRANDHVLLESDMSKICPLLSLKPYQLVGVNWLKLLHENGVNGVLADDMGLGKTVQTIAFLGWLNSTASKSSKKPHLIVVPASTLSNWLNELQRFCPSLSVVCYHGTQNDRHMIRKQLKKRIQRDEEVHVIMSTYTIFERSSCSEDRNFLYSLSLDYLILDEAHCLKNSDTSRYYQLNKLQTRHRLLLSGTPVQNDIRELLSLLSFLMPKVFRERDCQLLLDSFGTLGVTGSGSSSSTSNAKSGNLTAGLPLEQIRAMFAPFVLRRLKKDVLNQLMPKESTVIKLSMTSFQREVYDSVITRHQNRKERLRLSHEAQYQTNSSNSNKLIGNLSTDSLSNITEEKDKDKSKTTLSKDKEEVEGEGDVTVVVDSESLPEMTGTEANSLFTSLRKAANHPLLLRIRYQDPDVLDTIARTTFAHGHFGTQCTLEMVRAEIEDMSDFELNQFCIEFPKSLGHLQLDSEVLYDSPKMMQLKEMLPKLVEEGHRILIFSQWTRILDLLEVLMDDLELDYRRLDGSTAVKLRQNMIDEFTGSQTPVFLLATKAGGLGINLTAADTVILHDLDFNPENDRQAEDRCHRIGQTKVVHVYRLVTSDTVDEDICDMGERKTLLSSAVLADGCRSEDTKLDISSILRKALDRNSTSSGSGKTSTTTTTFSHGR